MIRQFFSVCLICLSLAGCATQRPGEPPMTPAQRSYLERGKDYFQEGRFKYAMQNLLPLATDGIPEAEYAVGYMYYYGYGVAIDQDVGLFWIKRAAEEKFQPAIKALEVINRSKGHVLKKPMPKKSNKEWRRQYSQHELNNLNLSIARKHFTKLAELNNKLALSFRQPLA